MADSNDSAYRFPKAETVRKPRFWRTRCACSAFVRYVRGLQMTGPVKDILLSAGIIILVLVAFWKLCVLTKGAQHDYWQREYDAFNEHCRTRHARAVCVNDFRPSPPTASVLPVDRAAFDVWVCSCTSTH